MQSKIKVNSKNKLPSKITPCPILQATVTVHFEANYNNDMVDIFTSILFGSLYEKLKKSYSNFEKLPIMQIPEEVRSNDEEYAFEPFYRISNNNYVIEIGPRVFSVTALKEYIGWKEYFNEIKTAFDILIALKKIKKITGLNVRYIDFFEDTNIFDKIKLNLSFECNEEDKIMNSLNNNKEITLRKTMMYNNINYTIQINNDMKIENEVVSLNGSIFDIECYTNKVNIKFDSDEKYSIINEMHTNQKTVFYKLIKDDFLKQFNVK